MQVDFLFSPKEVVNKSGGNILRTTHLTSKLDKWIRIEELGKRDLQPPKGKSVEVKTGKCR